MVFYDANNKRTSFTYDLAGRELVRRYAGTVRVTSAYDPMGTRTLMRDATGRYTATFDALDRQIDVRDPANKRMTYAYDAIGQRRRTVDPDNGKVTYTYDAAGRILTVWNPQGLRATFSYDAADRRTVRKLGNGTRTSLSYDNADRLTRIEATKRGQVHIPKALHRADRYGPVPDLSPFLLHCTRLLEATFASAGTTIREGRSELSSAAAGDVGGISWGSGFSSCSLKQGASSLKSGVGTTHPS